LETLSKVFEFSGPELEVEEADAVGELREVEERGPEKRGKKGDTTVEV